jgi:hypothetical protein
MLPTVFIENDDIFLSEKEIYEEIKKKNLEIIKYTESGVILEVCDELVFNVGKLDIKILDKFSVNVYDVPGLNDSRTKSTYYQYLRDNFHKFNIIIFLVDIHSGLNTSDEIDILRLITHNTKLHKENTKKDIYTLVVVNKADDMQIKIDEETGKEILYIDDELNEMYEQVNLTVKSEFEKLNIIDNLIDIIPLCGIDAYLYRMIKKYEEDFELKDSDILKIGINQMGKKFSKKTKENQRKEVLSIIKDKTFVEDMIKLSGFEGFEKTLYSFLQSNNNIQNILISNLLLDINSYPNLNEIFEKETDIIKLEYSVNFYINKLNKFKDIDEIIYLEYLQNFYDDIHKGIQYIVNNMKHPIDWFKEYYDMIYSKIIIKYFDSIKKEEIYPKYLKQKILNEVVEVFSTKKINIDIFIKYIEICIKSKIFKNKSQNIESKDEGICNAEFVLKSLINNVYSKNSITLNSKDISLFINCMNILIYFHLENKSFIVKFIRFILMNSIEENIKNRDYLLSKKMFYDSHNEIIMSNYLLCALICYTNHFTVFSSDIFLDGFDRDNDDNILEKYYIKIINE